ncbi:hypothetical protein [Microbacterium sp.]|uniref:hypothetical protein n=1 Tax=Microbacterium sp. TaxID=51671 RepID=UPI0039E264F0
MKRTIGGRAAAAMIVAVAALPLSGCIYAQIPEHPTSSGEERPAPDPTSGASDDPAGEASEVPSAVPSEASSGETMSFADGAGVSSAAYAEWGDGFFADDGWTIDEPDDGNGGWSYATLDGTCIAQFWQGDLSGLPLVAGDDSTSSDALLAYALGDSTTTADVTPYASSVLIGYGAGSNRSLDARQVWGEDGDWEWSITARAFSAASAGVYLIIDCEGGDLDAAFEEVVGKNPVILHD